MRSVTAADGINRARQPEIQHLHRAVRTYLHVRGLEIAVNDALLVRRLERLGDLPRNRQRLVERKRPLHDAVRERRALDELHHQRGHAARFLEAVDVGDVWMVQRSQRPGLALQPRQTLRIRRHAGGQHLDCHVAIEAGVAGAIDLTHAAGADLLDDVVRPDSCAARQTHVGMAARLYAREPSRSDASLLLLRAERSIVAAPGPQGCLECRSTRGR